MEKPMNGHVPVAGIIDITKYSNGSTNTIRRLAGSFSNYSIWCHNSERESISEEGHRTAQVSNINLGKLMKKPIEDQIYFAMADSLKELKEEYFSVFDNPGMGKTGRQLDRFCYTAAKIFEGGTYERRGICDIGIEKRELGVINVAKRLDLGLTSKDESRKGWISLVDDPRFLYKNKLHVTFDIADDNATYEYSIPFEMDGIGEIRSTRSERSGIIEHTDFHDTNRKNLNSTLKKLHIL